MGDGSERRYIYLWVDSYFSHSTCYNFLILFLRKFVINGWLRINCQLIAQILPKRLFEKVSVVALDTC